ncbi:hypothetical protein CRUP_023559, partial [Coryphaenoides rupestris]
MTPSFQMAKVQPPTVLTENLHGLATSLPRLLRSTDDHKKLLVLNVFLGYLKLLGPLVSRVLSSAPHLHRISKALMQRSGSWTMPGYYGNTYLLVDHFLDLYRESSVYRKQAAMVLNETIRGAVGASVATWGQEGSVGGEGCGLHALAGGGRKEEEEEEERRAAVVAVIEEYISERNWDLATVTPHPGDPQDHELLGPSTLLSISHGGVRNPASPLLQVVSSSSSSSSSSPTPTVQQLHSNIWQLCIQLEGVACGAHALGPAFRPLLMTSLYAVLEKAGDEALPVSQAALACARGVAGACGYASTRQLIADNSDYLLNDVSLNLHRLQRNPQVIRKSWSGPLTAGQSAPSTSLGNPGGPPSGRDESSGADLADMTALDVRQFLLDYSRQKELAEGIGAEEEEEEEGEEPVAPPPAEEEEEEEEEEGVDVKKELPAHVVITKQVMQRCTHLLLTDDDPRAVLRAFQVLCTLGEACGDFLRSRVSKEVLPRLRSSLAQQAPASARAGPIYSHTLAYKLQLAVLQGLGALCQRLRLGEADLDAVCDACIPYLSCRQPIKLQEACL